MKITLTVSDKVLWNLVDHADIAYWTGQYSTNRSIVDNGDGGTGKKFKITKAMLRKAMSVKVRAKEIANTAIAQDRMEYNNALEDIEALRAELENAKHDLGRAVNNFEVTRDQLAEAFLEKVKK